MDIGKEQENPEYIEAPDESPVERPRETEIPDPVETPTEAPVEAPGK